MNFSFFSFFLCSVVVCYGETVTIFCTGYSCNRNNVAPDQPYLCSVADHQSGKEDGTNKTAPAADKAESSYFIYTRDGEDKIGLNVVWKYPEYQLLNLTSKLFKLNLGQSWAETRTIYIAVNENVQHENHTTNRMLDFSLDFCDEEGQLFMQLDKNYTWTIWTYPLHFLKTKIICKNVHVSIPGCDNHNLSSFSGCNHDDSGDGSSTDQEQEDEEDAEQVIEKTAEQYEEQDLQQDSYFYVTVAFICGFSLLLIGLVCKGIHQYIKIYHTKIANGQHLLFLINTKNEDDKYLNAAQQLTTHLQNVGKVKVNFNLWENNESSTQPHWTQNRFEQAGHIILLCTSKGKEILATQVESNDTVNPFITGVQLAKVLNLNQNKRITLAYFENDDAHCLPPGYGFLFKLKLGIKVFCLSTHLKQFFQHVAGKSAKQLVKKIPSLDEMANSEDDTLETTEFIL
uniref:Uncharacterized protein LOC100182305 n=1 Tax=Phallusia mammillata TaxID=59560 RepID=A0A6F9DH30_9ASCI|nr:uncharacterized protein LOC100182305 [Phallusia mammillata]